MTDLNEDIAEQRAEILTVGDLRKAIDQCHISDDCRVAVSATRTYDARNQVLTPVKVWDQASDAYPLPFGTDPAEENTMSVLIIEVTP